MRWLSRIFSRQPEPPRIIDQRGLNEDWRVGDLALCLHSGWVPPDPAHPRAGDLLRVSAISDGVAIGTNHLISALGFEGKPVDQFWSCFGFRKVRPDQTAATDDFTALIKRPIHKPVGA